MRAQVLNARISDPVTSHQAAGRLSFRESQHQQIIECLAVNGDMGAEQIADCIGLQAYQVRKRLPELHSMGMVVPTERTRVASTRREERIWMLVGRGE